MLCKLVCNLYKLRYLHSLKVATGEREPRPGAWTRGLCSNAEFQPREPPIWPWFLVSNRHRYGHGWVTMLRPLRTRALRLNLCGGTLSRLLACAWAREPEVHDGALYPSLCTLSASVMQAGVWFVLITVTWAHKHVSKVVAEYTHSCPCRLPFTCALHHWHSPLSSWNANYVNTLEQ